MMGRVVEAKPAFEWTPSNFIGMMLKRVGCDNTTMNMLTRLTTCSE